jgi:H+/Cl- antiporter ClcA
VRETVPGLQPDADDLPKMTAASVPGQELSGWGYLRLVLLGALIGVPAALVAAGFLALVHYLQHWLWEDLPDALGHSSPPWYLVLLLPAAGAAMVLAARTLLPGDGGHRPLEGIGAGPPLPLAYAPGIALAALATLAFGGVLGPEAPLIALGGAVGLVVQAFVRLDSREGAVLSTAGSFSAISAVFGGPLVAGVLMMEAAVGLGAAVVAVLLPGFVAAAVGYVIIIGFGDWGGLDVPGLAVPNLPAYEGTHVRDLLLAVVVGLVTAIVVAAVRVLASRVDITGRARHGLPGLLLGGGLAVGALALIADGLGADSQDVLFSGQASVPALVAEDSTKIVVILLVAKGLAYAVCLGSGFRGGPVFPAIFLGIGLATLAVVWFDVSPTWAIAAGAAAGTAAGTRMILTSMLFGGLLAGTAGLDAIPAAVLAAAAAWLTITALERRSGSAPAAAPQA